MELLEGWLPHQPWFTGQGAALSKVGSFRFDDPDGEVGIETIFVAGDGIIFQVPLSYRGSPLRDAEPSLIGTMQHSVLGPGNCSCWSSGASTWRSSSRAPGPSPGPGPGNRHQ